jgi:hypothetical protein
LLLLLLPLLAMAVSANITAAQNITPVPLFPGSSELLFMPVYCFESDLNRTVDGSWPAGGAPTKMEQWVVVDSAAAASKPFTYVPEGNYPNGFYNIRVRHSKMMLACRKMTADCIIQWRIIYSSVSKHSAPCLLRQALLQDRMLLVSRLTAQPGSTLPTSVHTYKRARLFVPQVESSLATQYPSLLSLGVASGYDKYNEDTAPEGIAGLYKVLPNKQWPSGKVVSGRTAVKSMLGHTAGSMSSYFCAARPPASGGIPIYKQYSAMACKHPPIQLQVCVQLRACLDVFLQSCLQRDTAY